MFTHFTPIRQSPTYQASSASFRGHEFCRAGNLRSVILNGSNMNEDQLFGMSKAVQELENSSPNNYRPSAPQ